MELTPGERAVLGQIWVVYANARTREHHVTAITAQWPPIHYEAYRKAFAGLFAKRLIQSGSETQAFKVTDAGLNAIGVKSHQGSKLTLSAVKS